MSIKIPEALRRSNNVITLDKKTLNDTFVKDYNIVILDIKIKNVLKSWKNDKTIDKKIQKYKRDYKEATVENIKNDIKKKIKKLIKLKKDLENDVILKNYIKDTEQYIIQYKNSKNFNQMDKIKIIVCYLQVLNKYIEHNIVYTSERKFDLCNHCGENLTGLPIDEFEQVECSNCGNLKRIILYSVESNFLQASTNMSSSEDVNIDTFKRDMKIYRCLSLNIPDPSIYEMLENYFVKNGNPPASEIIKRNLDHNGRREGTSPKILKYALIHLGKENLIPYINYIGMKYWNWSKPPISDEIEEIIFNKRKIMHKVFIKMNVENKKKITPPPSQFLLWKHLEMEGFDCEPNDFKLPAFKESLDRYKMQWKLMCENTPDNLDIFYIP